MIHACCRQNLTQNLTMTSSGVVIDFRQGLLAQPFHPISCQLRAFAPGVAGR
jgi:hypothetical protein